MAVRTDPTPNPNAMKFSVGISVGGPGTYVKGAEATEGFVGPILEIEGVASLFFTADFVTISKTPTGSWETIVPSATAILESHFPG
ncbi:MAG: NifU N-terminal domain-containing protein [Actinomycetota bacterium]|nr:NifU N-terminal domain-containing protein [Actinomycetota bacterium]